MTHGPTTPYHEMPGERLAADVRSFAAEIAEGGAETINLPSVGYLLRVYAGLFNGNGPLSNYHAWERLPELAREGLIRVGQKSLDLLRTSEAADSKPIDITRLFEHLPEPDLTEWEELSTVFNSAQVSLEMVHDPNPAMRHFTEGNDLKVLSGQYDASKSGPILGSWGTSMLTREAGLDLLNTGSEEFGNVFGGCEMVLPDGDTLRRDKVVHYMAGIVGSQFKHPDYTGPPDIDFYM